MCFRRAEHFDICQHMKGWLIINSHIYNKSIDICLEMWHNKLPHFAQAVN